MENTNLKFEDVPFNWALCFNNDCPMKEQCLRHLAAATVPDDVTHGHSVWPNALKGDHCAMFFEVKYIDVAWGFSQLYSNLRQQDYPIIRRRMEDHFGRAGNYYRYNRGEKKLTPAQQQWIKELFAEFGYTGELVFDHVERIIQFRQSM